MTVPDSSSPRPRVVVVGMGMVAHRLLEALVDRGVTATHDIVAVGDEPHPAYDRVGLSACFDGTAPESLHLDAALFRDDPAVRVLLSREVVGIDRPARQVVLDDGERLDYAALVLATGALPFVPPVPGLDLPGVHVYRTLDDLAAIGDWARAHPDRPGIVLGGGLLGLEAANALRLLGLETHVVEMAPHLMPAQLDRGGAEVLRAQVEALGLTINLGVVSEAAVAGDDGAVGGLRLAGGTTLPAGTVVVSAGVRPRDALARQAGLELGDRGGIVIDDACLTSDPAIYAIGDVACVDGRCVGLVAPGYAMAEVVADRLAGGGATFPGVDLSTKLKLLGVEVASVGDAHADTPGALELVYADPLAGRYAKLVTTDDGRRVLGAVLVGDAGQYGVLRALAASGSELTGAPEDLVLPPRGDTPALGVEAMGDEVGLCSCNAVTVGRVRAAVRDGEADSVAGAKACTRAGTTCGSCVPMLKRIVDAELTKSGQEVSNALCEHLPVSRQELYSLVRVRGYRTYTDVVEGIGSGRGCDICKPAVASILATLAPAHALDGENAAIQDTNDHFLANMQKDGTYSVVPRLAGGEVTPRQLAVIASVAEDFGLYTKITGGQRIDMFGARVEQLPLIWRRLVDAGLESGHAYGKSLRTIKSCVGDTWCRYGVQDSTAMAIFLELRYRGLRSPHKLKSAVSGCARECAEAQSKDFGIIATEQGWNLYVGGNGGFRPRHGDLLVTDVDDVTLVRTIDRFLMFYIRTADRLQRTASWIESLDGGLDYLRAVVVDDSLGLGADLEADMAAHVATYADEWKGVLDDPVKLRRFVSFVNAPDVADPNIVHVPERSMVRPARGTERAVGEVLVAGPVLPVGASR